MNLLFQVMLFTWVHRIPIPRVAAPGYPSRNQEPHPCYCSNSRKKPDKELVNTHSPRKAPPEGASSNAGSCLPLREGGGTAAPQRVPPDGHTLLTPLDLFLLVIFPSEGVQSGDQSPQTGTTEMVLAILSGGPAAPALPVLFTDWWWSVFLFIRGRESGTTAVVLPCTQALGSSWMRQCSLIRQRGNKPVCHPSVTISKWTRLSYSIFSVQQKCKEEAGTPNENKNKTLLLLLQPRSQDGLLSN